MTADRFEAVAAWLATGAGTGRAAERVVETSIAKVFLFADRALKLKKPVDFGFLDFSTVERRRWAIERELTFNRATAPGLYRAVHAVTAAPGGFALDGPGEPIDWVLEMARFPDGAILAGRPEAADGDFAEGLGREIARIQSAAERVDPAAGRDCLAYVLGSNAELLRRKEGVLGREAVERLIEATQAAFEGQSDLLFQRGGAGFVRRLHGDLHLGNIMIEDGRPVLFDCIEFSDVMNRIDVLYDFGFLLMDLGFVGLPGSANRALNGWLDQAARGLPADGFWEGLAALPLFQSVRAAVRAHVTVNQDQAELARRYLAAAQAHLDRAPPALVAVGGYSGSGKTRRARQTAPGLGGPPGAAILRSDEFRKRLWGREPLDRLPSDAYAPEQSERVYRALFDAARKLLAAGQAVVLDAAFLKPGERAAAEAVAREAGAAFEGVWMEAPLEVLRARVAARTGDASDADLAVLKRQLGFDIGEVRWRRVS